MAYVIAKSVIEKRVAQAEPPTNPPSQQSPSSLLPRLHLTKFSGDQLHWKTFKERFTAMVKDVPSLPQIDELQHLLACLEGDAVRRLRSLKVTAANFPVAWEILTKRYDDHKVRMSAHMSKLLTMPTSPHKTAKEISDLIDSVTEASRAFTLLDRPVNTWDDWFVEIVVSRLDSKLREDWEKSREATQEFPTFNELASFLEKRIRTLETVHGSEVSNLRPINQKKPRNGNALSVHQLSTSNTGNGASASTLGCGHCKGRHFVGYCPTLLSLNCAKRIAAVKEAQLCSNYLRPGHSTSTCQSSARCKIKNCGQAHHTLLHPAQTLSRSAPGPSPQQDQGKTLNIFTTQIGNEDDQFTSLQRSISLLPTAVVVCDSHAGTQVQLRALLDPTAECSFLTERVVQALGLTKRRASTPISVVGGEVATTSNSIVQVGLRSLHQPDFHLRFSARVLGTLTSTLPKNRCADEEWKHLGGLQLADSDFLNPSGIDCILGAEVYPALILPGLRRGRRLDPVAQKTVLGWVCTGPAKATSASEKACSFFTTTDSISEALQKFWELEEVPTCQHQLTPKEEACEDDFHHTHARDPQGRYIVRLPFSRPPNLPGSRQTATARFAQLEKRLHNNPSLKALYCDFMAEFVRMDHMELAPTSATYEQKAYYMPHHAVFKNDGLAKIRVVFNASQTARSGLSLNDCLFSGPKLQTDITAVLSRWRFFPVVFTADIVKMFRQFRMHEEDKDWLRILWRDSPEGELQTYRMCTVVYGTACAPYQAIRTLLQLAQDERQRFPEGARVLETSLYVDDALVGGDTVQQARSVQEQLQGILQSAGMQLDKWSSNEPSLMPSDSNSSTSLHSFSEPNTVSTLGMHWSPSHDSFCFKVTLTTPPGEVNKRTMLSEVFKLFDPLGWLAPVVVSAKILIQRLWIRKYDWDQPVDDKTLTAWLQLRHQLPELENLRIPRWLGTRSSGHFYLHGFADASHSAYAAAIYVVTGESEQSRTATLLVTKTKLAPIKTISIPRLELSAALLLTRLLHQVMEQLLKKPTAIYCWSDSKLTLAWLADHSSRWTTFVANRVSEILTTLPQVRWNHVRSADNPADIASRGLLPDKLSSYQLWWQGPTWLTSSPQNWPTTPEKASTNLEEKRDVLTFVAKDETTERHSESLISRFSSLTKLTRTFAFIFRWRQKKASATGTKPRQPRILTAEELRHARLALMKAVQREHFSSELTCLQKGKGVLPFFDADGVMRIGGRLQNAFLPNEEKHPVIVQNESHLAELLIRDAHQRTLHGGPQLVTSYLQRTVWIVRGRNRIRRLTNQCVRCTRFRGQQQVQQMAPLPSVRLTPARPFNSTGLDYVGPFLLRTSKGRGQKAYKGYLALFVCMVTRAVHLEVVSDYTSQSCLFAFRRFTSRRGLCATVFSDNGTTFQGANAEIRRLFEETSSTGREIASAGVEWKFIPPRAPHSEVFRKLG